MSAQPYDEDSWYVDFDGTYWQNLNGYILRVKSLGLGAWEYSAVHRTATELATFVPSETVRDKRTAFRLAVEMIQEQPRSHTPEECRCLLFDRLSQLVEGCLDQALPKTPAKQLDLLVFSFLALIDGEDELPAFRLSPVPHPDDAAYHRKRDENWWPVDQQNLSDGNLHHRWSNHPKKPWLPE